MGEGTKESPYTREDVEKKIKEMKNSFDWVDLSGGQFKYKTDFRGLNLHGIILRKAILSGAKLEGVDLSFAKLEGADLSFARLEGADLSFAQLERADLFSTEISPDTKLADADWGNYVLDETPKPRLGDRENPYRRLKSWYSNAGIYDVAGKFFYREMEVRRQDQSWKKEPLSKLWLWILRLLCGYGEKSVRVGISAVVVIAFFSVIFFGCNQVWQWPAFWRSLYFSAVSFTAIGYGGWVDKSWINIDSNWIIGLGVAETILGVFMMALFLTTFTRKMTR